MPAFPASMARVASTANTIEKHESTTTSAASAQMTKKTANRAVRFNSVYGTAAAHIPSTDNTSRSHADEAGVATIGPPFCSTVVEVRAGDALRTGDARRLVGIVTRARGQEANAQTPRRWRDLCDFFRAISLVRLARDGDAWSSARTRALWFVHYSARQRGIGHAAVSDVQMRRARVFDVLAQDRTRNSCSSMSVVPG